MKNYFLLLLFLFSSVAIWCQNTIRGTVYNEETNEPLSFVNIINTATPTQGTMSDIDGNFTIESKQAFESLSFSFLGFESKMINVENEKRISVYLKPSEEQLNEVVITDFNPAIPIMEKVIANRESNHPQNLPQYFHKYYNKTIFTYETADKKADSVFNGVLQGGHILVMESVSEKKYLAPGRVKETVIGNKVSGFKNPMFVALATDMQPFTFYEENIALLNSNFLNPISDGALKKYNYKLQETVYRNGDTIHQIYYSPKEGKNIEGLKGLLYINTKKYAIQNVIASPATEMKIELKIQQQYQLIDDETWFPEQLNYELKLNSGSEEDGEKVVANGKSYVTDVNLSPNLTKKDFDAVTVKIDENANQKDSLFWEEYRAEKLDTAETTTYRVIDSLGNKYKFDKIMSYFEKLPQGKLPIGKFDIDLTKTFIINQHEGFRLGTGIYTNEKLFKDFSFGGYGGYGLRDHEWKFGAEATYHFNRDKELYLKAGYQNDLQEIGSYGLPLNNQLFGGLRDFMASKMDRIQQYEIEAGVRTLKYIKLKLQLNQAKISPVSDYHFEIPDYNFGAFHHTSANLTVRYAPREKLVQAFQQNISMGTPLPIFTFNYTKGFEGLLEGDLDYQKIEARVEQQIFLKNLGTTKYRLQAGYVDSPLPLSLLFTGEGSYDKDFPVVIENTFQTMMPYEFLSDTYVDFFFTHNFGSLLLKEKNFSPEIIIHQNVGWGTLEEDYPITNFKTKEDIYLEAGLEIAKIVKINYLNVGYLTLGAGGFYRYGNYSFNKFEDDFVFKINSGFSFY